MKEGRKKGEMIVLLGFSGGGKTTVGALLSEKLGIPVYDTDAMIEQREGKRISDIFAEDGEEHFRDLETDLLRELTGRSGRAVLAIGGGMPVREENRIYLKQLGTVFYLKAEPDTLLSRLRGDTSRPLLKSADLKQRILQLLAERENIYLAAADKIIPTDQICAEETAERIIQIK